MRSAESVSAENAGQEEVAAIATGYRAAEKRAARRVFWNDLAIRAVFVLLLVAFWQYLHYVMVTRSGDVSLGSLFPSPLQVGQWLWNGFGFSYLFGHYQVPPNAEPPQNFWEVLQQVEYPAAILASLGRLLQGYIIAVVIGIPVGLLVAKSALLNKTIGWLALSLQALPSICWIPLALLWFSRFGDSAPILFVTVMGALFATIVAVADGIRQVPPLLSRAGRTLGADGLRLYFSVLLPAALPSVVIGLRIGWSFAWRSLMAAELIVNAGGLGFLLDFHRSFGDTDGVLATIIVVIMISLGVQSVVFGPLERRLQEKWGLAPPAASTDNEGEGGGLSFLNPFKAFQDRQQAVKFAAITAGILVLAFVMAIPLVTSPSKVQQQAADLKEVTIGYNPTIALPQALVGVENDEFARLIPGVVFKGKDYTTGPAVLEALRSGVVDIAYSGPFPPLKAYLKDKDVVLLGSAATGGTELMVLNDSPYHSIKDLKGKRIGVNQLGSTVDAMVRYQLLQNGINPERDVKMIPKPPADQSAALLRGEVDAVAAPAPWPSQVGLTAKARPLLDWRQILDNGDYTAGSVYTTQKFAKAHPDFIRKFIAAHRAITHDLNQNRTKGNEAVLRAWTKVTGKTLPPELAKSAFATIQFTSRADPRRLERLVEVSQRAGFLKGKADLTGFIYNAESPDP